MKHSRATEGARDAAHRRRLNLERVLVAAIDHEGPFTRGELIRATGLSAPTVGTLASHLIRMGLLTDLGAGPSRVGRRPGHMHFNARHGFVAGIDLGPTRTRLAIADLRGELVDHRVVDTPQSADPAALLTQVAREVRALMRHAGIPAARLLAVGAGAPGAVDQVRGMVVALAPNLSGWTQVPMASILKRTLGAPVVVENDVNLAILGEHWKGAAGGHQTCAFLTFGTGVGGGIMVDGRLHHGDHFLAGEIGLMCMGPDYVERDFGSRGCLETVVGLGAIKARWATPSADSTDWIGALLRAADAGDPLARRTVDEAATFIAIATANVCSVLDPSLIVLGGALIAQGDRIVGDVRRTVGRIIPMPPTIVPSALDKEAPLWGGLLVAMKEAREQLRQQFAHRRIAV